MTPRLETHVQSRLELAIAACWQAGKITLEYFQTDLAVESKDDGTPVTIADQRAEQALRRILTEAFPEDNIVGEEYGRTSKSGVGTWYLDPIDGTKSFIAGVPFYGVLLAYELDTKVELGVAHFPALNETIWARRGGGCFWNGRKVGVSAVNDFRDVALMLSDYKHLADAGHAALSNKLLQITRLQRTWGDAYGHILVATGRAEIMLDPYMSVWDCGPLLPIVEEAGGKFTDWQGVPTIHGKNAFSTNGHLHAAMLKMIAELSPTP